MAKTATRMISTQAILEAVKDRSTDQGWCQSVETLLEQQLGIRCQDYPDSACCVSCAEVEGGWDRFVYASGPTEVSPEALAYALRVAARRESSYRDDVNTIGTKLLGERWSVFNPDWRVSIPNFTMKDRESKPTLGDVISWLREHPEEVNIWQR